MAWVPNPVCHPGPSMLRRPVPLLLALAAVLAACGSSGAVNPVLNGTGVKLHRIGKFENPVWLTSAPGDRHRLFVVEKTGAVRVIRDGRVLARPFLDLRGRVSTGSEQGLLSIAFAPDYQ